MIDNLSNILFYFFILSNLVFCAFYFQSLFKLQSLNKNIINLSLKNLALEEKNKFDQQINFQDTHQENFIKFLSDSRDWAFEYIDKSQQQIKEFIDIADKEFAFFDSFGILTQQYPHYESMKIISEEYKKLKDLLPKENDDRR